MSGHGTCLVVGAGGFLGSHVCRVLREQTHLLPASSDKKCASQPHWLYLDVTEPATLQHLPRRVDSIIYLAQSPHYKNFPAMAPHIWEVNVQGVLRLLEYARQAGVQHFILASTGSVYASFMRDMGQDMLPSLRENAPLVQGQEGNFYIRSRLAAELLLNAYSAFFSTVCLRLFTLYGPGLGENMLLSRIVHAVQENLPVTLGGEDGLLFNPIYADDAARAIAAAVQLENAHTINVAGAETVTLGQVCRSVGHLLGRTPAFVHEGPTKHMVGDINTMCSLLTAPRVTLQEGLKTFICT